jgi:hypothetical protein
MRQLAPTSAGTVAFGRVYLGSPDQIQAVRGDLRGLLDGCPMADDVILCVSELAANGAQYSDSRMPGGTLTVRAEIYRDDYVWIEVEDNGGPWIQPPCDPGRGHGLDIIRALATDWGIDGDHASRIVWACIDWPEPESLQRSAVATTQNSLPSGSVMTT